MKKKDELFDRISRLAVFAFCLGGFLISNIWIELKPDIIIYKILSIFFLSVLLAYLFAQIVYLIYTDSKNKTQEKTKALNDNNNNDNGTI